MPSYLDWVALYFKLLACCCRPPWYKKYRSVLETAQGDMRRSLDIV